MATDPVQLIICFVRQVWVWTLVLLTPLLGIILLLDQMFSIYLTLITKLFRTSIQLTCHIWSKFLAVAREIYVRIRQFAQHVWTSVKHIAMAPFRFFRQFVEAQFARIKLLLMIPYLYLKKILNEAWMKISGYLEPLRFIANFVAATWRRIVSVWLALTDVYQFGVHIVHLTLFRVFAFQVFIYDLIQLHRAFDATKLSKTGQLAVVTGGGRGIGSQVVKKLMQADMDVIIGLRNPKSVHELMKKIRDEGVTTGTLEALPLDLLSIKSVREFAKKILDKNRPVRALVNNAGIMFAPYQVTEDGFESHFQVNYLSHFLLTHLLMPRLKEGGTPEDPSRVVNVSSSAHYGAWSLDFKDLQVMPKEHYDPYKAYALTKFLQVASANFLNAKLKAEGANVTVNSLHPGIVATELYNQLTYARVMATLLGLIFMTVEQGADTVAYAAISPELGNQGGIFLANSQPFTPNKLSFDLSIQKKLYDLSNDLIAVKK